MPERDRPDPDALLALINAEGGSAARQRGRLKVFFGATAGVGKTYAMLQAAQERRGAGADVVVGLVETHGRRETEALLEGLVILPRKHLEHRGVIVTELDLDAALARRPQLLLVDELAHTNAPGSRHAKRWQDVEELRAAGIDVYTTLNVQHLESLNDVVARITGVTVRETLPDAVLEMADEVELIDLPPEELLQRLEQGKVYVPEQAERAMERFFRRGNLIALRQLALLRTADRVDRQMEIFRRAHAAAETWPVRDRLLVGVGSAPSSERLVRATKRMADRLGAEWRAVFVQTPAYARWTQADRDGVWETLRLAEELGARTATLSGTSAAAEILDYARAHNVTKIVVGKPTHTRWRDLLGLSFHDEVVRGSGPVDVYVITGEAEPRRVRTWAHRGGGGAAWPAYGWAALAVALSTGIGALMFPFFERTNIVMVYLLAVVLVAMRLGRRPAVLAAVLGVAAFDVFFVPPYLTFAVSDTEYVVTFAVMLVIGLVVGTLAGRLRQQGIAARERERRTAFLYDISRDLVQTSEVDAMLRLALPRVGAAVDGEAAVLLPDSVGDLHPWREAVRDGSEPPPEPDPRVARWVHANRRPAGLGTDTYAEASALYLPLAAGDRSLGVVEVRPADPDRLRAPEQLHLLESVVDQIAVAVERARLADEARRIRELEEMDRLRSEFVAVASHELKSPLTSLVRSLGLLRESESVPAHSDRARRQLLDAAAADVERLSALVSDLLDLTRLEAGRVELGLQPVMPADLVARAVMACGRRAAEQRIELASDAPSDLPVVEADPDRIAGVLATLVDNAVRYTDPGGHVLVSADHVGRFVQFSVADDGAGIAVEDQARVFDTFARLPRAGDARGTGLSLAIAREVVRAHRGAIWVDSGPGPGTVFGFTLPLATATSSSAWEPRRGPGAMSTVTGNVRAEADDPRG